ncbi:MAG: ATP-binding protein, partial [Maioricimonas sp. JB049]
DQAPERIERLRAAADMAIYTPGSDAGRPISVLRSLDAPPAAVRDNLDAFRERISSAVSGLLTLLDIEPDPIRSREHILLSNILDHAWREGRSLTIAELIHEVQSPPFSTIGIMDLETIFPAKDRTGLAMTLNNLLASPGFAAWMQGEPLNIQTLLYTPEGRPRLAVLSIAHLGDRERMFFVTLLLNELLSWMRAQPGTSSLRALLYMDEVFGYLPPTANPASKTHMLALLKQARAFGLGLVLSTQNPVDLDYKALSNAGTWFLGRLQTERDKQRVLDGLEGASASAGVSFDRQAIERTLSGLGSRVFLMNNVHEDAPVLFETRWVLSYLRGPLTREQIRRLTGAPNQPAAASPAAPNQPAAEQIPAEKEGGTRPLLPDEIDQRFEAISRSVPRSAKVVYRPALLARGKLHFVDLKSQSACDVWQEFTRLADVRDDLDKDVWEESTRLGADQLELADQPDSAASFADLPPRLARPREYAGCRNDLKDYLYREVTLDLTHCPGLKLYSQPEETEGEFRIRLTQEAREQRDLLKEKLTRKYAPKLERLQERIRKAEQRVEVERSQANSATLSAVISFGSSLLGALTGRKTLSRTNVSRAATSARSASRAAQQRGDISRAQANVEALQQELDDLDAEFKEELEETHARFEPDDLQLEPHSVRPRKSDIAIDGVSLLWRP